MSAGTVRYPAPSVYYPIGRSRTLAAVLALVQLGSLAILVAWFLHGAGAARSPMLASLMLWASVAALALRFWMRLPVGTLGWDGEGWQLHRATGSPAEQSLGEFVVVQIDLQHHLALSFPAAHPGVWLLVEQQREPARWLDMRRAVYSRPSAARPAPVGTQPEGHSS